MSKLEALAKDKRDKGGPTQKDLGYVKFLTIFMGLLALFDQYLALIEGPLIPYILDDFGVDKFTFALWQGIFGIITFSVFIIGWYSDAYGRRKGVLLLMLVMGLPCLFILFAFNFWVFMILYSIVIMGTLSNLWELPITEEAPQEKRAFYGSIAFMIGLFPLFALIGIPIAESALGWRWGYGIMFFFMIALIIIWWKKMEETERWKFEHEKRESKVLKLKETLKKIDRKDAILILTCSIIYALWSVAFKFASSWGGEYFISEVGYTAGEYQILLLTGALLLMVGAVLSGVLMEKGGRNLTLTISCIGSATSYILLGLTASPIAYLGVFLFMPMALGWIMVYFAEMFPTEIRSTAVGISATGARVSYVVGPLLASLIFILFVDSMSPLWLLSGIIMIAPLAALFLKPYETKGKSLEEVQAER